MRSTLSAPPGPILLEPSTWPCQLSFLDQANRSQLLQYHATLLRKWSRTAGSRRRTLRPNGEPAKGIPHTLRRASTSALAQEMNRPSLTCPLRRSVRHDHQLPQFLKLQQWFRQQSLQTVHATTITGRTVMVDTDDAEAGSGRLQPSTDCSMQGEEVAGKMLDEVFKSWPCECGNEATKLFGLASCSQC